MTKRSKAYQAAAKLVEPDKIYSPLEAAKIVREETRGAPVMTPKEMRRE